LNKILTERAKDSEKEHDRPIFIFLWRVERQRKVERKRKAEKMRRLRGR